MKIISKEQFHEMAFPKFDGKNVIEAKMVIHPNNTGVINGNKYSIKVNDDGLVELEKIEDFKE